MAISEKLDNLQRGPTVTIYSLTNAGSGQGGSTHQIFTYTEAKKQAVDITKAGIYEGVLFSRQRVEVHSLRDQRDRTSVGLL